ncbi:amino acid ABC transporter permease [Chromatiaceae bacterium AAb-1]|nr:amino acid ABC transporter permease [Chromatiaceae bacterium AAb-1]
MDWQFMLEQIPDYLSAIGVMLAVGGAAVFLALLIGGVFASLLQDTSPLIRAVICSYIEVARNTPLIIQLFLLYFGLPAVGVLLPPELCAVMALTFMGGAYFTEVFRAGFSALSEQQSQASYALGLSRFQTFRYILWPQVWQKQLPATAATACFLLRETTVVSAITVAEVMYTTTNGIAIYYMTYEFLTLMTISCVLVFVPLSIALNQLEHRWRHD